MGHLCFSYKKNFKIIGIKFSLRITRLVLEVTIKSSLKWFVFFRNFKSNSIKQIDIKIEEANLYLNQLVEINKLIATSGTSNASNDVLDARDKLLIDLSKLINFTVDYASTGEAIIRLGDSGNGAFLVNRGKGSTISSSYDDKNVSLVINEGGGKNNPGIFSSGIIYGISNFYNLVDIQHMQQHCHHCLNENWNL